MRNFGISAHIDSGKTTLTERILFYTGRIKAIHEVKGKDGVGAKMDSMDLEREKGITIKSAATFCQWKGAHFNIIDTPGHVDFTIEVERSLRVLDGAVLVLCAVGGVQSQTMTVDRQMRRYNVPRIAFINKCDRSGADPYKVLTQIKDKLRLSCAFAALPIGLEDKLSGLVDVVHMRAIYFEGETGSNVRYADIPADMAEAAKTARRALVEAVGEVDDEMGDIFLSESDPTHAQLEAAIRRATIKTSFVPVLMGSAYKNKGVQVLLDAISAYLPSPFEKTNEALDTAADEAKVVVSCASKAPLIALAFKLEQGPFGQLTYMRVYQGTLKRGDFVTFGGQRTKLKVPRLVRMHSDEMEDITEAASGEICAMFGVDCYSGDTFSDGTHQLVMTSMHVPSPVMSLAIEPKDRATTAQFSKALNKFTKEDPTFRVGYDNETKQTIISGMGELHLEIYKLRMEREYNCEVKTGAPRVNYRETITSPATFDYTHKKQSGGQGQYGKVIGGLEPLSESVEEMQEGFEFENRAIGNNIPGNFIPAIEKGFKEACEEGPLIGHPVSGLRAFITDGAAHSVDSNELAFKLAAKGAFRQAMESAGAKILEPVMKVEVSGPEEYQGVLVASINRRKGVIKDTMSDKGFVTVVCEVALSNMFGYSTDLRSSTQGKGEFTMEYSRHAPVPQNVQLELVSAYQKRRASGEKK